MTIRSTFALLAAASLVGCATTGPAGRNVLNTPVTGPAVICFNEASVTLPAGAIIVEEASGALGSTVYGSVNGIYLQISESASFQAPVVNGDPIYLAPDFAVYEFVQSGSGSYGVTQRRPDGSLRLLLRLEHDFASSRTDRATFLARIDPDGATSNRAACGYTFNYR